MSTIITPWGWFNMGTTLHLKLRVKQDTFENFMNLLPKEYKGDVSWRMSKAGQRVIQISQMTNWTGWDRVRRALEQAKTRAVIEQANRKLGFGEPKVPATMIGLEGLHVDCELFSDD